MRRGFLIGLSIGTALGFFFLVTLMSLSGKAAVFRSWPHVPSILAMLLLIASAAGAAVAFKFLED